VGYVGSVEEVRETVEGCPGKSTDEDQREESRKGKRRLDDIDEMGAENVKRGRYRNA
jgi:hypothetical protein